MSVKIIIVSFSGGKDSTACLLKALAQTEYPVQAVYQDTGFEHPALYAYLDYVEEVLKIEVLRIRSETYKDVPDYCEKKETLPGFRNRGCTGELKIMPMRRYLLKMLSEGWQPEVWLGVRAAESAKRRDKYGELSETELVPLRFMGGYYRIKALDSVSVRFPIVQRTDDEVFEMIERAGIRKNPLYDSGFKRVGCFPCVMNGENGMRKAYQDPVGKKNIEKLIFLEEYVSKAKGKPVTFIHGKPLKEVIKKKPKDEDDPEIECSWCHS